MTAAIEPPSNAESFKQFLSEKSMQPPKKGIAMKKFVFLMFGYETPTAEVQKAWMDWFGTIGEHIVDGGSPFGMGREVSKTGSRDLPLEPASLTGYCIMNAASIDDAEKLLESCPIIHSVRIYEAASM